jgi:hypothetical protein
MRAHHTARGRHAHAMVALSTSPTCSAIWFTCGGQSCLSCQPSPDDPPHSVPDGSRPVVFPPRPTDKHASLFVDRARTAGVTVTCTLLASASSCDTSKFDTPIAPAAAPPPAAAAAAARGCGGLGWRRGLGGMHRAMHLPNARMHAVMHGS